MKKIILLLLLLSVSAFPQGNTTKVRTATSLPATCTAGDAINAADEIALVSGGNTALYICKQTNTWNQVGGASTFDQVGAGSNLTTLTMGNAGSLKPLNLGQVAGNQVWLQPGLSAPSTTGTLTGGTVQNSHAWLIQYTLNSTLGETLPSVLVSGSPNTLSGGVCGSGASCTLTVTAPTLPSGYTSYNVYACDTNGAICTLPQKVAACTAITGNCVFTANYQTNTTGVPTINTAIIAPPNVQATNGPAGSLYSAYFPKVDGNYYPWLTTDITSCDATTGPPLPCGTPLFTHRTYFNDTQGSVQNFKNAFISIAHTPGVGTVTTNQDRALALAMNTPTNDSATRYGLELLQAELDFNCNGCTINGSPDAEVTAGSFQLSTAGASTNWNTNQYNTNAVQGRVFRSGAGFDGSGINAVYGDVANSNTTASAGSVLSAVKAVFDGIVNAPNISGVGVRIVGPTTASKFGRALGIFATGSLTPAAFGGNVDYFIRNDVHNWNYLLNGKVGLTSIENTDGGLQALPVNASINDTGSLTVNQIASAQAGISNATCSGGASLYTYQLVFNDGNGGQVTSTAVNTSAATCVNPLTGVNPATINFTPASTLAAFRQAKTVDIYRVGGPMGTGKIGTLTCNGNLPINGCTSFSDTGIAAGAALPTTNTTGGVTLGGDLTLGTSKGQHVNTQAANNDFAGTCTAAAATTCTVTFTRAYTAAPICTATDATNITTLKVTPSTSSLIITTSASSSDVFDYICVGNPN